MSPAPSLRAGRRGRLAAWGVQLGIDGSIGLLPEQRRAVTPSVSTWNTPSVPRRVTAPPLEPAHRRIDRGIVRGENTGPDPRIR